MCECDCLLYSYFIFIRMSLHLFGVCRVGVVLLLLASACFCPPSSFELIGLKNGIFIKTEQFAF